MAFRTALGAYTRWSSSLRAAYLRAVPGPVLGRIDPPLRRTIMLARHVAATPFYLHQRVSLWSGPCGDETARVALWGKPGSPRDVRDFFFDGEPAGGWEESVTLPSFLRNPDRCAAEADVLLAETTPTLAPAFVRRGFLIVPARVRFGADVRTLLATMARPSSALDADLRRIRRNDYRTEVWSYTRARSELAYRRYVAPHARARFDPPTLLSDFAPVDRLFAAGLAVAASRPASPDPDALGIVVPRGRLLWFVVLGARDGDLAVARAGGLSALYAAVIRLAHERGMERVDVGRCLPWRSDGVLAYKWKWGFRPIADTSQTLEYAIKVLKPESAAAHRLGERGVIVRERSRFSVMGSDGRLGAC